LLVASVNLVRGTVKILWDVTRRLAAWVAPDRIARERACRCQRLLVGRRARLMERGVMMTRALAMLAADVAAIG
jgi:hypothetical protein